jgi:death-on-curing protein
MFGGNARQDYMVLNYLHSQVMVGASRGSWGQRDPQLTRAALARPYYSAFGEDIYRDVYDKAAALMDAIINNVVFRDGNKRTAVAAAALYLGLHEQVLDCSRNESDWFTYQMVVRRPPVNEIADWLRSHTRPKRLPSTT